MEKDIWDITAEERDAEVLAVWRQHCLPLMQRKGQGYATNESAFENFRDGEGSGVAIRAGDKNARLQQMRKLALAEGLDLVETLIFDPSATALNRKSPLVDLARVESLFDTVFDGINYLSILAVVLLRKKAQIEQQRREQEANYQEQEAAL